MNKEVCTEGPCLKVAVLLSQFPCISETFILNQITYLVEQGHQVDIYSYGHDGMPVHPQVLKNNLIERTRFVKKLHNRLERVKTALPIFLHSGNRRILCRTMNPFKFGKDALSLRFFFQTELYSIERKYDIVHAHFAKMGIEALRLKELGLLANTPLITSFHGYDINPRYIDQYRKSYKALFEKSNIITANSNFTSDLIIDAKCPEDKIVKIPESLDTSFFKRAPIIARDSNQVKIVFCGRLIEFKAPELVVEIANMIINIRGYKQVEFHIIGSGPLRDLVLGSVRKFKLESDVIMHGALIQDEILKIMGQMDIFLYPGISDLKTGRSENQGLVIQEAQAMQLPVVTSDAGGIPEGLVDGKTGYVLPQHDINGFSDKLELLINNPDLRKEMGLNGRDFVVNNFDIHPLGERLVALYYNSRRSLVPV